MVIYGPGARPGPGSEARLRLALDAAGGVGAWEFDVGTDWLSADDSFWSLHGLPRALQEPPGNIQGWLAMVHIEDREALATALHDAATRRVEQLRFDYRVAGSDGQTVWLLARGRMRTPEEGGTGRLIGVVVDVTEQHQTEKALRASEERYEAITNSIDQMIWSTRPDGFHDYYNLRWYEFTGMPIGSTDGEAWNGMFHPDDQQRAWERWRHSLETGEPYHIEYRLRHRSGQYRWVIGRAQCVRDAEGRIVRWYGTCTDIDDLKEAEAQRELIARELSHRIRNIFAVVSSLVMLPARDQPEARPFAMSVQARIQALASAHEYVRPHSAASAPADGAHTVKGLLDLLVSPYNAPGRGHIAIEGDDRPIGPQAATAMALTIHELATNAVKYGALSSDGGLVTIVCSDIGEQFSIRWQETGGPAIDGMPTRRGFGTTLSERVASTQLGATLEREWLPEGLVVVLVIPVSRLLA
ncbi:PAS domain-containing protein [Mesorhizobium sp. BR1-1-16]|uniref:sensor histidine kinase n=1 Tax=Mesorhizobium sp. BR1-1-16 TaxID=2876653 RepID=UPI001CCE73B4|nr:PAS domain-containing protein [Mesorhizobium sp. BR1-1-16]MBZ9937772.1 PAS domain-containing protein [Mesorhizobium sp. BR1-1-16]